MKTPQRALALLLGMIVSTFAAGTAEAACAINAIGLTITPLTASTGTYTPPSAPSAQQVTFTVSGTYTSVLAGTCRLAVSFNRASLPASMAISGGGGATLPYTITSAAGGGNTLLYTGAGLPAAANLLTFSFPAPVLGVNQPFSVNLTAYFQAIPGTPQAAGNYSDNPSVVIFDGLAPAIVLLISRAFTVTGAVAGVCTIGGIAHPTADVATIPISAVGVVNTSPIPKSYLNAACNAPSQLQLTSQKGAVTTTSSATGFAKLINYSATASFSGANASLNTATNPAATGPESGTAIAASGGTPTGTLSVTITPQANSQPLITGSYSDTLTITITPQ